MADEFVKVASVSDIPAGDMMSVRVGSEEILLVNVDGDLHACDDICTHAYANLSEGDLEENEVVCPLHGAVFDVALWQTRHSSGHRGAAQVRRPHRGR